MTETTSAKESKRQLFSTNNYLFAPRGMPRDTPLTLLDSKCIETWNFVQWCNIKGCFVFKLYLKVCIYKKIFFKKCVGGTV